MIYYTRINSAFLNTQIFIAKNKKGILKISFTKDENEFANYLTKHFETETLFSPKMMYKESSEMKKYLKGRKKKFSLKYQLEGTDFQVKVWKEIAKIPYGQTITYSQLAKRMKVPKAVRAVANACGDNPIPIIIPCHRVIAKDDSLGGYTGGVNIKKNLLRLEKVEL